MAPHQKLIVVLGPTSSGKSSLAIRLAKKFHGEVISADSRQVYRELNIGTGKITKKEMRGVPHHLLNILSPKRIYTTNNFKKDAEQKIKDIAHRKKIPIICGGTGLYIDALVYNLKLPEAKPNPPLREKLEKLSAGKLFRKLEEVDPRRAKMLWLNSGFKNKRRLIRALEIIAATGRNVPIWGEENHSPGSRVPKSEISNLKSYMYDVLYIGIKKNPRGLKRRIESRVKDWLKKGLIAETRKLARKVSAQRIRELGFNYSLPYKYLEKQITKEELQEKLQKENWKYVKRQITWFKRNKDINWVKNGKEASALTKKFLKK